MTNSAVIRIIRNSGRKMMTVIRDSISYRLFILISEYLKNASRKSVILGFFLSEEENIGHGKFAEWFSFAGKAVSGISKSLNRHVASAMKASRLISAIYGFYSNVLYLPLRTYGVISLTAGTIYISLTLLVSTAGTVSFIASAGMIVIGLVLCLFRTSPYEVLADSAVLGFVIGRTGRLSDVVPERRNDTGNGYIAAVIIGTLIAVIPVLLPTMYALAAIAAIIAVPLVMIWPFLGILGLVSSIAFIPTMAAAGMIIIIWTGIWLNCALNRLSIRGVFEKGRPLVLFMLIILSGGILSFAIADSILIAFIYIVFISTVYLFMVLARDRLALKSLLFMSASAAFMTAVYGIYQYLTGNIQVGWIDSEMFSNLVRIYSTFENPNVYGEYLLFMIPLSLMLFFTSKRFIYKLLWFGAGAAMLAAMMLTMSRGCWIGLAVGVFIYFLIADRRFLWLFLAAVVILPFILPESIMFRILSIGNLEDSSSLYRLYIWLGTFRMLKDYWFTGVGLGTEAFSGIYSAYAYNGIIAPHPHNLYLNVISETGITGLLCLGWITLKSLRYSISSSIGRTSTVRHIGAALAAAFTGFLVQGIFDNAFYNYRVVLIFWIFTAFAFTLQYINNKPGEETNG